MPSSFRASPNANGVDTENDTYNSLILYHIHGISQEVGRPYRWNEIDFLGALNMLAPLGSKEASSDMASFKGSSVPFTSRVIGVSIRRSSPPSFAGLEQHSSRQPIYFE